MRSGLGGFGKRRIILTGAGSSAFAGEAAAMAGKEAGIRAVPVPVQSGRPRRLVKDLPLTFLPRPLVAPVMRLKNLPPGFLP